MPSWMVMGLSRPLRVMSETSRSNSAPSIRGRTLAKGWNSYAIVDSRLLHREHNLHEPLEFDLDMLGQDALAQHLAQLGVEGLLVQVDAAIALVGGALDVPAS